MSIFPVACTFVTPRGFLAALFGFLIGGSSLDVNPFFASSVIAVVLWLMVLHSAAKIENVVILRPFRIFAIIRILGDAAGVVVLLFPGLGLRS